MIVQTNVNHKHYRRVLSQQEELSLNRRYNTYTIDFMSLLLFVCLLFVVLLLFWFFIAIIRFV